MEPHLPNTALDNGLDLSKLVTTGSILHINQEYDDTDIITENSESDPVPLDFIGEPVPCLKRLEEKLVAIDQNGFVKKRIMIEGGGLPLHEGCTVFIAFSGYWENETKPFDVITVTKPMEVDLKDHGLLLPGLEKAVKSMLVGETSVFLLSYKVMYGEMGVPPRIKAKSDCAFFIRLVKSILTAKEGKIRYSESNMFQRVHHEVKMLFKSGTALYKSNNYIAAIQLFNKAVNMLHKCRLADEAEEKVQEKLLTMLYTNLVICYNKTKQPYKACIACNELNRLNRLWSNGKVLYNNAKALRMIGQYQEAERKLKRAIKLCPNNTELEAELVLLKKACESGNKMKCAAENVLGSEKYLISNEFKQEVDNIVNNFKNNSSDSQLVLPAGLNSDEIEYLRGVCTRENLFFNKIFRENVPRSKNKEQPIEMQSADSAVVDDINDKIEVLTIPDKV